MDHVAIMNKKWRLIDKILSGEKTIESRWYKTRRSPWNKVKKGDSVYFKNSGEPIIAKATITKIHQHVLSKRHSEGVTTEESQGPGNSSISTPEEIYNKYGKQIGLKKSEFQNTILNKKDNKYCILIWLENPKKVEPFKIDKTGFGIGAAWLVVDDINLIRKLR